MIRTTNFPLLLLIALYERQAKKAGTTNFYDTVSNMAEKVFDTLPRSLKRMSKYAIALTLFKRSHLHLAIFEGLAGSGGDIDAVCVDYRFLAFIDLT